MKPKGKGHVRSTTDATEEIDGSDDEFDEPIISALGKRDRLGGLSRRDDGKKDSSGEEAERPQKNRVGRVSLSVYPDRPDFRRRRLPDRTLSPPRRVLFIPSLSWVCHASLRRPMRPLSLDDEGTRTNFSIQTASRTPLSLVTVTLCFLVLCLSVVVMNCLST